MLEKVLTSVVLKILDWLFNWSVKEVSKYQKERQKNRRDQKAIDGLQKAQSKEQRIKHAKDVLRGL